MSGIVYFKTTSKNQILAYKWIIDPESLKNSLICSFFRVDSEYHLIFQSQQRGKQLDPFYKLQFDIMRFFLRRWYRIDEDFVWVYRDDIYFKTSRTCCTQIRSESINLWKWMKQQNNDIGWEEGLESLNQNTGRREGD